MEKLIVVLAICAAGVVVAAVMQRRAPSPPTPEGPAEVPSRLDRRDFGDPDAPWLVVLFTSNTCGSCDDVRTRVEPLRSPHVAVFEASYQDDRALHRRYRIESVPMCLVVDAAGEVRRSFIGAVSSTHLWGALAELRDPGSVPGDCAGGHDHTGHDVEGVQRGSDVSEDSPPPGT